MGGLLVKCFMGFGYFRQSNRWWLSFLFVIVVACTSLQHSVFGATSLVKHVMLTASLRVCGATTMNWLCDTISESRFGHGSSLIICVGILTGYTETLHKMLNQISGEILLSSDIRGAPGYITSNLLNGMSFVNVWAFTVLGLVWNKEFQNMLASASADKKVKVWDVDTGQCKITMEHHIKDVQAVAWNHYAPEVLLSGSFEQIVVLKDGRQPSHAGFRWSVMSDVESLAWDPHNEHSFVVSLENGTVKGFDIRAAQSGLDSDIRPSFST